MTQRSLVVAFAALLAGAAVQPARAGAPGAFNGTWTVEMVTEGGLCDARYSYSVAIQDGQLRLASAADAGTRMSGHVSADGSVGLTVAKSGAGGVASGRLQVQGGAGTWKVSALCSGRWTARRVDTRTAQAE